MIKSPKISNKIFSFTFTVYLILFLLGLWGCLSVYNAMALTASPWFHLSKQFVWLMLGMIVLFTSSLIPFKYYRKLIIPISVLSYLLLILVLVFGKRIHGMQGWFVFFDSIYMQPSEFAKTGLILSLTFLISKFKENYKKYFILYCLATILWIIPIILQPDFGTALIYIAGSAIVFLLGGGKKRVLAILSLAFLICGTAVLYWYPYVLNRFSGFISPFQNPTDKGWHVIQLRYTIARGGLFGQDFGQALWANSYLPLSHSDSAFATLCESVGFIGGLPVIIGFGVLFYLTLKTSFLLKDRFSKIFILSIISMYVVQAFTHISVNVTLIPVTGITLPLISYGGSSLVSLFLAFGISLSAINAEIKN